MTAPSTAPTTVPIPRCSARANTEPKSGRSTIATVSTTQYERCDRERLADHGGHPDGQHQPEREDPGQPAAHGLRRARPAAARGGVAAAGAAWPPAAGASRSTRSAASATAAASARCPGVRPVTRRRPRSPACRTGCAPAIAVDRGDELRRGAWTPSCTRVTAASVSGWVWRSSAAIADQLRIPAAGPGPARGEVVPGLVQRGRRRPGGRRGTPACRPRAARGPGPGRRPRCCAAPRPAGGQPPGQQQQQRPGHAGQQQQRAATTTAGSCRAGRCRGWCRRAVAGR